MQTIEEYKEYTKQLEGEVKRWHDAFDASETINSKLVAENRELKESVKGLILDNYLKDKELRHHKYKRCLAMARWCCDACDKWMMRKANTIRLGKDGVEYYHQTRRKISHYMKWQARWMTLAEKF